MLTGQYPVCHIQTVKGTLVVVCCSFNMSRQYLNISSERFPFYINIKCMCPLAMEFKHRALFYSEAGPPPGNMHKSMNEGFWYLVHGST